MRGTGILALSAGISIAGCGLQGGGSTLPRLGEVREFVIPWANAFPSDVVVDGDGRVWFTDRINHVVGMFDPESEQFRHFDTPTQRSAPYGIIVAPDGMLWFGESVAARIARLDPRTGEITEYAIEGATSGGPHMLAWHDGMIWFTMRQGASYGRFDPQTGTSVLYPLERSRPYSITATADAIWFNDYESTTLNRVDPRTGAVERRNLGRVWELREQLDSAAFRRHLDGAAGQVRRITSDRSGALWYSDFSRGRVQRYMPQDSVRTTFEPLAPGARPYGIAVMRNGLVWFAENGPGRIVVLDPHTEHRVHAELPTKGGLVRHLVVDEKRGRAWLPMSDRGILGLLEYR